MILVVKCHFIEHKQLYQSYSTYISYNLTENRALTCKLLRPENGVCPDRSLLLSLSNLASGNVARAESRRTFLRSRHTGTSARSSLIKYCAGCFKLPTQHHTRISRVRGTTRLLRAVPSVPFVGLFSTHAKTFMSMRELTSRLDVSCCHRSPSPRCVTLRTATTKRNPDTLYNFTRLLATIAASGTNRIIRRDFFFFYTLRKSYMSSTFTRNFNIYNERQFFYSIFVGYRCVSCSNTLLLNVN
ncbi:hypothetical protein PUN28_008698 [Cardiocondyla obscurior]|uniref:Uncharacterized protein n=1 Tax=Cardiocondyla obscurior TaxID=286306 RepID=A0AAW2FYY5_9HYME